MHFLHELNINIRDLSSTINKDKISRRVISITIRRVLRDRKTILMTCALRLRIIINVITFILRVRNANNAILMTSLGVQTRNLRLDRRVINNFTIIRNNITILSSSLLKNLMMNLKRIRILFSIFFSNRTNRNSVYLLLTRKRTRDIGIRIISSRFFTRLFNRRDNCFRVGTRVTTSILMLRKLRNNINNSRRLILTTILFNENRLRESTIARVIITSIIRNTILRSFISRNVRLLKRLKLNLIGTRNMILLNRLSISSLDNINLTANTTRNDRSNRWDRRKGGLFRNTCSPWGVW